MEKHTVTFLCGHTEEVALRGNIDTQRWRVREMQENEVCPACKGTHEKTEEEKLRDMKVLRKLLLAMNTQEPSAMTVERMLLDHGRTFSTEALWEEEMKFEDYEKITVETMYTVFHGAEKEFVFSLRIDRYHLYRTTEEFTRAQIK